MVATTTTTTQRARVATTDFNAEDANAEIQPGRLQRRRRCNQHRPQQAPLADHQPNLPMHEHTRPTTGHDSTDTQTHAQSQTETKTQPSTATHPERTTLPASRERPSQRGRLVCDGGEPGENTQTQPQTVGETPATDDDTDEAPDRTADRATTTATEETSTDTDDDADDLSLTPSVRKLLKADRNNECQLCGTAEEDADDLHIHHRVPREEGGDNHPHNLLVLCQDCHRRHHGNEPIDQQLHEQTTTAEMPTRDPDDDVPSSATASDPLPPHSEPNGADKEILQLLETQGPLQTGAIAAQTDYSNQYVRRQCWKLSGEQLTVRTTDGTWALYEQVEDEQRAIGLPESPKRARRAGRDEVIRKMAAHGLSHTEIIDITDLSRSTIDIAINRARALRLDDFDDDDGPEVDLTTIAMRVSALLDLIEHAQE